jgi:subtilisin family serine protease
MLRLRSRLFLFRLTGIFLLLLCGFAAYGQTTDVLVLSTGSKQALTQKVQALGGKIRHDFQNVNAVSATVPQTALAALATTPGLKVRKTGLFSLPVPADPKGVDPGVISLPADDKVLLDSSGVAQTAKSLPADYSFNNAYINASALHGAGHLGQGVIVALIDSGTANNENVVPAISGTVIGGESFVPAGEDLITSATSTQNGMHGTWTATMIAGHALFLFTNSTCFVQSLKVNAPDSVLDAAPYGYPGYSAVPMIGVAPAASVYALKVFPSAGGGAPEDRIIAAMDHAITLKKNFLAGKPSVPISGSGSEDDPFVYDSLNIGVVNMSLGGPTTAAGRDLEDLLTQEMAKAGITLAASTGNAGPAGLTTGSPSTGLGSIASAASLTPAHERIYRDLPSAADPTTCRLGRGMLYHPTNTIKTAYFSSRGPTADGRVGVDVISAGYYNFVQGPTGGLYFVSGTSFAAPSVAGAAALLREAVPQATGIQVRNAIIKGANPRILGDKSTRFDQGKGYLDVANSLTLLQTKQVSNKLPAFPAVYEDLGWNLAALGIPTYEMKAGVPLKLNARHLAPGQRREFIVQIGKELGSVDFNITNVTPKLPPQFQNQLFGDDVIFSVHSAKTSAFGQGDYRSFDFVNAPYFYHYDNPEPGYMRVTLTGDWTNAGEVSTEVILTARNKEGTAFSKTESVTEGDFQVIPYAMPSGKTLATFQLEWNHDWGWYPTNDLDMILVDPDGKIDYSGATLNGRETANVENPKAGQWMIVVNGFTVYGKLANDGSQSGPKTDRYRVRVWTR